jgi:seryl-tRNA synthetase
MIIGLGPYSSSRPLISHSIPQEDKQVEQDFIAELDKKVSSLIQAYADLKKEKEKCSEELSEKTDRIQELEGENGNLKQEMQSLKDMSAEQQKKLDSAADKVKEMIAKLEEVE